MSNQRDTNTRTIFFPRFYHNLKTKTIFRLFDLQLFSDLFIFFFRPYFLRFVLAIHRSADRTIAGYTIFRSGAISPVDQILKN